MDDGFQVFVCYLESDLRAQIADIISYAQIATTLDNLEQRREYESTIVASKANILIASVLHAINKTRRANYQ